MSAWCLLTWVVPPPPPSVFDSLDLWLTLQSFLFSEGARILYRLEISFIVWDHCLQTSMKMATSGAKRGIWRFQAIWLKEDRPWGNLYGYWALKFEKRIIRWERSQDVLTELDERKEERYQKTLEMQIEWRGGQSYWSAVWSIITTVNHKLEPEEEICFG